MSKIISQSGYGLPCSGSIFSNIKPCFHDILFALLWKRWNLKKSYLLKNEDSQHIAWLSLRHQQGQKHQPLIDHQLSTYNLNYAIWLYTMLLFFSFNSIVVENSFHDIDHHNFKRLHYYYRDILYLVVRHSPCNHHLTQSCFIRNYAPSEMACKVLHNSLFKYIFIISTNPVYIGNCRQRMYQKRKKKCNAPLCG